MRNIYHAFFLAEESDGRNRRKKQKARKNEKKLNKQSILCSLQQMKIAVRLNKNENKTNKTKR